MKFKVEIPPAELRRFGSEQEMWGTRDLERDGVRYDLQCLPGAWMLIASQEFATAKKDAQAAEWRAANPTATRIPNDASAEIMRRSWFDTVVKGWGGGLGLPYCEESLLRYLSVPDIYHEVLLASTQATAYLEAYREMVGEAGESATPGS